jgi:predicted permease
MPGFLPPRVRRAFHLDVHRRGRTEADVDDELRFHLEQRIERLVARGWSRAEAEDEARRRFGPSWDDAIRQLHRQGHQRENRIAMRERLGSLWYDLRHSVRALRRDARYTLAVVLTLALGLGATTTIVSFVDQVLVRPLPYAAPERLVVARVIVNELRDAYPSIPVNAYAFQAWQRGCGVCAGMAAVKRATTTLQGDGDPQRFGAARVTANMFDVLGVKPYLGRTFREGEDVGSTPAPVAVLAYGFWRRQFGGDPAIVGKTIRLNDRAIEVIGVLPPDGGLPGGDGLGPSVGLPQDIAVYRPFVASETEMSRGGMFDLGVIVRLRPGATPERLRGQLDDVLEDIVPVEARTFTPGAPPAVQALVAPLHDTIVGGAGRPLLLLLGAVAAVLLIVCTNLTNLALARDAMRRQEAAVRVALGASRGRLTRLALVESVALSLAGGALGLALAFWGLRALVALAPPSLPRVGSVALDGRAFAIATLVACGVGILMGIYPALRRGTADPGESLRSSSRSTTGGRAAARRRAAFIGAQVAIGTVLLVATGLFVASLVRVLGVDRGFDSEHVLAMDFTLPVARYDSAHRVSQYYDLVTARAAAVPGVRSAAITNGMPLEGETWLDGVAPGEQRGDQSKYVSANLRFVTPGYLATVGTTLRAGRDIAASDRANPNVAVVSERVARTFWPGQDPIGKQIAAGPNREIKQVVGVAADVRSARLEDEATMLVYLPTWLAPQWSSTLVVRAAGDPATVAPAVRAALRAVDATVPVPKVRTAREIVSAAVAARRFQVALLLLLAAMAFVTASIGIYGVIAQSLAGRRGEIGVRLALGAHNGHVYRLVFREGLVPVAVGLVVGIGITLALGKLVASQLYAVRPGDPATLATVIALLGGVAVVACAIPARRATATGLTSLLRFE